MKILPNRKVIHEINRLPLVLEGDRKKIYRSVGNKTSEKESFTTTKCVR